jgi:hypothetical protein
MGGFSFGNFAGGMASGISPQTLMQIQQQKTQQGGEQAFGDALAQLYGGQSPGGAPSGTPPMPGGSPMAGPGAMGPQMGGMPQPQMRPPMAGGQPGMPPGGPPGMSPGGSPPQMGGQPPQMGGAPPGGAPQPGGQPQGQGQPGQPQMGMMQLPDLVQGIMRAKPGIKGAQLAAAVNAALPLMNAQGLMQWRQLQAGFKGQQVANQTANTQDQITNRDAGTGIKQQNADTNAGRLSLSQSRFAAHVDEFKATTDMKIKQLAQTKDLAIARSLAQDVRSAIAQKGAALSKEIAADNSFDETAKTGLVAEAKQMQTETNDRLDEAIKAQRDFAKQNDSTAKPEAAKADGSKDAARVGQGSHKVGEVATAPDGKKYSYKGGDWDAQESWEPVQ